MPFINPKSRDRIKKIGVAGCEEVGDPCYVFYRHLVEAWKLEPRWRTAHRLYRDLVIDRQNDPFYVMVLKELLECEFATLDVDAALELAWQVFFVRFVMPYELEKIDQNGDIQ
jgi:hypothetical protein